MRIERPETQTLKDAAQAELIEIFEAFDVTATLHEDTRRLELAVSVAPQLIDGEAVAGSKSQDFGIARSDLVTY